jgi:hypothetical protein
LGHLHRMLIPQMPIHLHGQCAAVLMPEPAWRGQNLTFCAISRLCSRRKCP